MRMIITRMWCVLVYQSRMLLLVSRIAWWNLLVLVCVYTVAWIGWEADLCIVIDFSDRLTRRKKAMYRSIVRRPASLDTTEYEMLPRELELQETPMQKLRRLMYEVQELNEHVEKSKVIEWLYINVEILNSISFNHRMKLLAMSAKQIYCLRYHTFRQILLVSVNVWIKQVNKMVHLLPLMVVALMKPSNLSSSWKLTRIHLPRNMQETTMMTLCLLTRLIKEM